MSEGNHARPKLKLLTKGADDKLIEVVALWSAAKVQFTGRLTIPEGVKPGDVLNVFSHEPKYEAANQNGNGASRPATPARKTARAAATPR